MNKVLRITPTRRGGNHAFTLIEIITALAIMVIGLLSILALFPVGFHASKRAVDFTQATLFAQEKMEEIKMKGFDDVQNETAGDTGNTEGIFEREVSILDVPGYDNLKEIIVTISWTERGQSREEEFKTYLANYAP